MKKNPLLVGNEWEEKMFITMEKRDLILKTPLLYSIWRYIGEQSFLRKCLRLTSFLEDFGLFFFFFLRTLIPVILFPETLLGAPILF